MTAARYGWLQVAMLGVVALLCQCTPRNTPSMNRTSIASKHTSQQIRREVYKTVEELLAQHRAEQTQGITFRKFMRGDPRRRWVALTFDDGPHLQYTPRLVQLLRQYNVKATFFVVGKMAEQYPDLIRLLQKEGHEIGNHTYDHVNLTRLSAEEVAAEIERCGRVIYQITKQTPSLFRPPGGDYNQTVARVAESLGYWMVLWTDDPGDYTKLAEPILQQRLLSHISNGGIILLHDGGPETLEILPKLFEYLRARDYEVVPVGVMIKSGLPRGR